MEPVQERFLRYVKIDTPSDEGNAENTPSTECQKNLANLLVKELKGLGLEAEVTPNAYVYSHIPANCKAEYSIGFIAHIDVVDVPKGFGVKPVVHANGDITSDGATILGADDKAGVAEIMAFAEYLLTHPEIKHGKIGIAFTPDEEIGHGAKLFDVKKFGCDFAYTVDGEELGELSYETFNAAAFTATFKGVNTHPGQAKGKLINAVTAASEFISLFPKEERPETTEGREGFYFLMGIEGGVEECIVHGIVRDHDRKEFERRKAFVKEAADRIAEVYGDVKLDLRDQYYNCAQVIEPHAHLIENAKAAMEEEGVKPLVFPVRGGTDGSSLSYMGLPCPNIGTGGLGAHSTQERVNIGDMNKVVNILVRIAQKYAK